jgi:hypothetical protein
MTLVRALTVGGLHDGDWVEVDPTIQVHRRYVQTNYYPVTAYGLTLPQPELQAVHYALHKFLGASHREMFFFLTPQKADPDIIIRALMTTYHKSRKKP